LKTPSSRYSRKHSQVALRRCGDDKQATDPAFLTFRAAAQKAGVPYYQVQRSARAGRLPTYRLFGGRRYLKWDDVLAIMDASREGGDR
jgi:hypothetical protein